MFQTEVIEKIITHILCTRTFFECRASCEIMWGKYGRAGQAINNYKSVIWLLRFPCFITKATNTNLVSLYYPTNAQRKIRRVN